MIEKDDNKHDNAEIIKPLSFEPERRLPCNARLRNFFSKLSMGGTRAKKRGKAISLWQKWFKRAGISIGGVLLICLFALIGWFGYAALDMPDTKSLWSPERTPEIIILDRHGREIMRKGGTGLTEVNLDKLPPFLVDALIATEDRRFYKHFGFDPIGMMRAAIANYKAGKIVQGGSTITQQLAKNIFLTREKTLKRKTQELMFAVWLEIRMSKKEILQTYLSRVYFGGGTVGIESGAKRFFNKQPSELELNEAAFLIGLLKAPDRLNPLKNKNASALRTAEVLEKMYLARYIDDAEYIKAMTDPIEIEPVAVRENASAYYFTDWVLSQLETKIGELREDIIVQTTLDLNLQKLAQSALIASLDTENARNKNIQQAALVSFDATGAVQAMIGGVDYQHSSYNRAIMSKRQPGSSFKPIVYLAALESGLTPWDIIIDRKIDIDGWKPGNFSNQYLGAVSLEKALALSINTVAVQISEKTGREKIINIARRLGIDDLKPYASLALGAQEISLYQLVSSYIPFANWGYRANPYGLEVVFAKDGRVLYEHSSPPRARIISPHYLRQLNLMLKTAIEQGTGKNARIAGRDIAGKTGTTNDYRDAWFVGYSSDLVTGVWVGNDDNSKMARVTGGSVPAKIWKNFMQAALKNRPNAKLPVAEPPVDIEKRQALEILLADLEKALP